MDNYTYNRIRRSNGGLWFKLRMIVTGILRPAVFERKWQQHVNEFQAELNANNWNRHGFRVDPSDHKYHFDRFVYVEFEDFAYSDVCGR
jgi:hypothetical protein